MERMPNIRWNRPSCVTRRVVEAFMFTLFLTTLITSHQAGIIDSILHHKYRSLTSIGNNHSQVPTLPLDPINASSSSVLEHFEGHDGQTTSVEYQSPIEKIMEIISGKPRPIYMMDQHKQMEPETIQSSAPPQMPTNDVGSLNFDQNWAIIGPAERYIPQGHGASVMPQASHTLEHIEQMRPIAGEHQRFQQTYTSQHLNDLERQILERAASIQNRPREPQPILLGSYVPHQQMGSFHRQSPVIIPSPMVNQRATLAPTVLLKPVSTTTKAESEIESDSDQESPTKESGDDSSDNETGDDKTSDEAKKESSQGNNRSMPQEVGDRDDDAETSPEESKSGGSQAEPEDTASEEEPNSNQGSSSYHENYDSDTMDEPSSTASGSPEDSEVGESSNQVLTGLINVGLNDDCLQCICRASSGCDYLLRCITRGADEKYCGPFQITEDYWKLAGSPGDSPNNFSAFDECANEADCAVETVTNYMKRFHKDCDGDGNITCLDYARLHRLKPDECEKTEKLANNSYDAYWAKFQRCAEGYNRSRSRQDEEDM